MAYLRTLEGNGTATAVSLDQLFDVNDTLGCLLFGVETWNRIKAFAADRALELLAAKNDFFANLKKITGKKTYYTKNDILDRAFGFNHSLGCELYGAEEWHEFVRDCKASTVMFAPPTLGGFGDALKALIRPSGTLYPENWTPGGIFQWAFAPGLTNVSDAFSEIGSKNQSTKAAESQAATYKSERDIANANAQRATEEAAERIERAKEDYNVAYANSRAQADADAAANKQLQYDLKTNPEYMANQRNNIILLCGAGLLALAIMRK